MNEEARKRDTRWETYLWCEDYDCFLNGTPSDFFPFVQQFVRVDLSVTRNSKYRFVQFFCFLCLTRWWWGRGGGIERGGSVWKEVWEVKVKISIIFVPLFDPLLISIPWQCYWMILERCVQHVHRLVKPRKVNHLWVESFDSTNLETWIRHLGPICKRKSNLSISP